MKTIKAIETRYAGHRFRSRLEARWAVFFDTLGEPWEYEKEGFELPSGRYLPDFWLPNQECWFEVKGEWPNEREHILGQQLSTENPVVFGIGNIGQNPLYVMCHDTCDSGGGWGDCKARFALYGGKLRIVMDDQRDDRVFMKREWDVWEQVLRGNLVNKPLGTFTPTTAINAAKSARFEFGR